ncbi:MAG TPA: hypothetical protein VG960_03505 [Caulobacteraceae bacterium]|nr:hypothetical protein [Caulobacteraceae bacterium]
MSACFLHLAAALALAPSPDMASDPKDLSAGFWSDWQTTKQSEHWQNLQKSVGLQAQTVTAAGQAAQSGKQAVVDTALTTPAQAAKFMTGAAADAKALGVDQSVSTVLAMRATPKTVAAAAPLIPPESRPAAHLITTAMTRGIAGLPGVYLGEVEHPAYEAGGNSGGEERGSAPAGYAPVAGGSLGCPGR